MYSYDPYILHQFSFSPFCEKVRLMFSFKGLEYGVKPHLPLIHRLTTYHLSGQTNLPVLVAGSDVISGSGSIMRFLDRRHPSPGPLYPDSRRELHRMQTFIQKMDVAVGLSLFNFVLQNVLKDSKLAPEFFVGPDFSKLENAAFKVVFPFITPWLKQMLRTGKNRSRRNLTRLTETLDELDKKIKSRKFFFGNKMSAADLTLAALLVPLVQPVETSFEWKRLSPRALHDLCADNAERPVVRWAGRIYHDILGGE